VTADLGAFLNARLDDDERIAKAALGDHYSVSFGDSDRTVIEHIDRWTSARVLADVQAKRAILAEHPSEGPIDEHWSWSREYPWCTTCSDADDGPTYWPCRTVLLLASVYADHPDFNPEWDLDAHPF